MISGLVAYAGSLKPAWKESDAENGEIWKRCEAANEGQRIEVSKIWKSMAATWRRRKLKAGEKAEKTASESRR